MELICACDPSRPAANERLASAAHRLVARAPRQSMGPAPPKPTSVRAFAGLGGGAASRQALASAADAAARRAAAKSRARDRSGDARSERAGDGRSSLDEENPGATTAKCRDVGAEAGGSFTLRCVPRRAFTVPGMEPPKSKRPTELKAAPPATEGTAAPAAAEADLVTAAAAAHATDAGDASAVILLNSPPQPPKGDIFRPGDRAHAQRKDLSRSIQLVENAKASELGLLLRD